MNKIQQVSRFFRVLFQVLFLASPIVLGIGISQLPGPVVLFNGVINMSVIPHAYSDAILHTLSLQEKFFAFVVEMIPTAIEMLVLYFLVKLFRLYERGEIFSLNNVRCYRNISFSLLAEQLLDPIYQALMGVVLTMNNPHGHRFASISFDQTNVGILLMSLLVILISWIMAEGCRLREEQQLTI